MRLRGYHAQKLGAPGAVEGFLPTSYYYAPKPRRNAMRVYSPIDGPLWSREWSMSWRDIDRDVVNSPINQSE
jgi:hypothetical protein